MASTVYLVGFSGNRPKAELGRSHAELETMRPILERTLDEWAHRERSFGKRLELYASVAEGADTIACEAALACGIPVHLLLPKTVEAFRDEDFAEARLESWARVESLIALARQGTGGNSCRVLDPIVPAPDCYEKVNTEILDASDAMMILWNGTFTHKGGGAGDVLLQTQERRKPYVLLNTLDRKNPIWTGFESKV